jgi:hypothetical protein
MHRKLDNPVVFVVLVGTAIAAFFKAMQWAGTKMNAPGVTSFYGGNGMAGR